MSCLATHQPPRDRRCTSEHRLLSSAGPQPDVQLRRPCSPEAEGVGRCDKDQKGGIPPPPGAAGAHRDSRGRTGRGGLVRGGAAATGAARRPRGGTAPPLRRGGASGAHPESPTRLPRQSERRKPRRPLCHGQRVPNRKPGDTMPRHRELGPAQAGRRRQATPQTRCKEDPRAPRSSPFHVKQPQSLGRHEPGRVRGQGRPVRRGSLRLEPPVVNPSAHAATAYAQTRARGKSWTRSR